MSATENARLKGSSDAQQGKGALPWSGFNSSAEREAYNAAYNNAKK